MNSKSNPSEFEIVTDISIRKSNWKFRYQNFQSRYIADLIVLAVIIVSEYGNKASYGENVIKRCGQVICYLYCIPNYHCLQHNICAYDGTLS